jgi:CBS domain-containing protein
MTRSPVVVDWRASLDEAYRILQRFPFRHLPVVEGDTLVGVVSVQDLFLSARVLERESARGPLSLREMVASCPVGEVIRGPKVTVSPADSQARVVRLMLDHGIDAVPVTSEGRLVGIVTATDLIDSFVDLCLEHGAACDAQVFQYMRRTVLVLSPDVSVPEALEQMDPEFGYAVVQNGADVLGIVSSRELRLGLVREMVAREGAGKQEEALCLRDVISPVSNAVEPASRMSRAALKMVAGEIAALPVTRQGRALGMLSRTEILRHYASCL